MKTNTWMSLIVLTAILCGCEAVKPQQKRAHEGRLVSAKQALGKVRELPEVRKEATRIKSESRGESEIVLEVDEMSARDGTPGDDYWNVIVYRSHDFGLGRWNTFLVGRKDGEILVDQEAGAPVTLQQWRSTRRK